MAFEMENGRLKRYHPEPGEKRVVIPKDVTVIGHHAFSGCQNLEEAEIPRGVKHIAKAAFSQCTGLKTVMVSQGTIGDHAFDGCTGLIEAVMEPGVTSIGVHAFSGCKSLRRVSVAGENLQIGSAAFKGCDALADERGFCIVRGVLYDYIPEQKSDAVWIPEGVRIISALAFSHCTDLTRVRIAQSVTRIGAGAFECCGSLQAVELPPGLLDIGECAFLDCANLHEIEIPAGVSVIPGRGVWSPEDADFLCDTPGVFEGCTNLKRVVMHNGLTQIGIRAFSGCTSLSSVEVPDSVQDIGAWAFCDCHNLHTVRLSPQVKSIHWTAFCWTAPDAPSGRGIRRVFIPAMPKGPEKERFLKLIRWRVSKDAEILDEA